MTRVAVVDVGTNSVRLLVAESGDPLKVLDRRMRVNRLGAGVDARGRLDDTALERTLDCIERYARRWAQLEATRVRIAATSAVRDAADRDRFFEQVRRRTGVPAEVVTGDEEARSAFRGATAAADGQPPFLVVDVGGGSTEFILGSDTAEAVVSRQVGCVRLTERCLRGDPPTAAELAAAREVVDAHLDAVAEALDPGRARTLIGVAGTATTVGALHLGLPAYLPDRIHATRVPAAAVQALAARLARMTVAQLAALGPMAAGREDVIVGGALILAQMLRRFGFVELLVSEADGLDGMALELLDGPPRA